MTLEITPNKATKVDTTLVKNTEQKAKTASEDVKTAKSEDVQKMAAGQTSTEIKAELDKLQQERDKNIKKMEKIEEEIESLAQDAKDKMVEAAKQQEKIVAEYEEDSKDVLNEQIKAYIEANKDGGNGMSRAQLSSNIKNHMPTPALGEVFSKLTEANSELGQIDALLVGLNSTISDVKLLDIDIETMTSQYNSALSKEAEEASKAKSKSCDPIGFTTEGKDGLVRYDFIIDDGKFDNTSDFLGAQNQWADMEALDTSGDSVVSAKELGQNNIKLVKTTPDGKQEIVDIEKEFGSDFSIDLKSYKQGGSHDAIDTTADFDNDGIIDQNLLGTFSINMGEKQIKGYNTLDDVDFLEKNYNIKNDMEKSDFAEDLVPHVNFFTEYSEKASELRNELSNTYASYGVSEDMIREIDAQTSKEGQQKANLFLEELEKQQEAQKAKEAEEEKETEEAEKAEEEKEAEKDEEE